ncbi:MAG: hypothetical protein EOO68_22510, partial [Moraxellaceae bacterium]
LKPEDLRGNHVTAHHQPIAPAVRREQVSTVFFKGKPFTLILHGDIATPISIVKNMDFVVYRIGNSYSSPVGFTLSQAEITTRVANGIIRLAQENTDYLVWNNGQNGQSNLLLRGTDLTAPAIMLTSFADSALPLTAQIYSPAIYRGISDSNVKLSLVDLNYDGRKDLLLEDLSSDGWKTAYIADAAGVPISAREITPSSAKPVSSATHVGTVGGQFRVDESGAATYSVPISVADGVAGVKPQIALGYSSQSGDGIAGHGWTLGGLSAITRCRQTLMQDNNVMPLTWTADDKFCFNGQRLMLVSGTYGSADSTYKTEIDTFALVTAKGGTPGHPTYFIVENKDGSKSYYGNTVDSKLVGSSSLPATSILSWSINRFEDNVGNGIDYVYTGDATSGQRIARIYYAYNLPAATGANNSYANIEFVYEARSLSGTNNDSSTSYSAGYAFKQTQRLKKINVYNNNVSTHAESKLRTYTLEYMSGQSVSRLQSVSECVGQSCFLPLIFSYDLIGVSVVYAGGTNNAYSPKSMDIDKLLTYQ